jgi:hypothetical protein
MANNFEDLSPEERERIPRNLITTKGRERCRFEMFVHFPIHVKRPNPYTYRGDMFGITDPGEMLRSLLRLIKKDYYKWHFAELYDNVYETNDTNRLIFKIKNNNIETNRLKDYEDYLKNHALPDWLKTPIPQPNK